MKAVVFHGIGEIRLDDVPEPKIEQPTDAIVRITASAICGTDLHLVRGTVPGMQPGTIIGHEGVGVVEDIGRDVRHVQVGDRVVIPSTIACGYCSYCRASYYSKCDNANPNGPRAGTAFYGGPKEAGPFNGLQAEKARIVRADANLVKLPHNVTDDQAILLSDIFPTAYFGTDLAEIKPGHTVAIFGCGPVGQLAIFSAWLKRAGRIFAVDAIPSRMIMAAEQGAETIDYNQEDPVQAILDRTGGIGVDCAIDAVGVDANRPMSGPALQDEQQLLQQFQQEVQRIVPQPHPADGNWHPGNAPSQVHDWAVKALDKAGTLGIIGVYPKTDQFFPIGAAFGKNLTIRMGDCPHRRYIPTLLEVVQSEVANPARLLTQREPMTDVIAAYKEFDRREPGWVKVELLPSGGQPRQQQPQQRQPARSGT